MNEILKFKGEVAQRIKEFSRDKKLQKLAFAWLKESMMKKYVYNFSWLGRPIIQQPQDMIAMQEIIWEVKPDVIIETGIAHGGSLIYYASLLELTGNGEVLGIDIDIRPHNRRIIEQHPMFKRITMIEGSSISESIIAQVRNSVKDRKNILVCLDSHHTHQHVLKELEFYSSFVSMGSYIVVFDTFIEYMPDEYSKDRPCGKGNNPQTAVREFLNRNNNFVVDKAIENKLVITTVLGGYLKRIK